MNNNNLFIALGMIISFAMGMLVSPTKVETVESSNCIHTSEGFTYTEQDLIHNRMWDNAVLDLMLLMRDSLSVEAWKVIHNSDEYKKFGLYSETYHGESLECYGFEDF